MGEEAKAYRHWCRDIDAALAAARTLDLLGFDWSMRPKIFEENYRNSETRRVRLFKWLPLFTVTRDVLVPKTRPSPGYELTYSLKPGEDVSWIAGRAHTHIAECK